LEFGGAGGGKGKFSRKNNGIHKITLWGLRPTEGNIKEIIAVILTKNVDADIQTNLVVPSNDIMFGTPMFPPAVIDLRRVNITAPDAFMVDLGLSLAHKLKGAGFDLQLVLINKGLDRGIYSYFSAGYKIGLDCSVGLLAGPITFNYNNSAHSQLNRTTFTGFGCTDAGSVLWLGGAYTYAFTNGWPFGTEMLYHGVLLGYGKTIIKESPAISVTHYISATTLLTSTPFKH
jgi:hypothetical protein